MQRVVLPALWLLALSGCSSSGESEDVDTNTGDSTPTLRADVQPILDANCAVAGCHSGATAKAELRLTRDDAAGELIDAASTQVPGRVRVVPGNVDESLLVEVLRAPVPTDPPEPGTVLVERMPRDTSPLSEEEIDTIERWIEGGAPLE